MRKLTEITRRELFDIIQNGFSKVIDNGVFIDLLEPLEASAKTRKIIMPYYGRLTEIEFLDRLYDLEQLPSTDKRYKNAKGDIYCHTISFNDWPEFWFLDDDRFELKDGFEDEKLLRFLCEMLHPAVRDESSPWKDYLDRFNELLRVDGYELYSSYKISGRDIFKYREYVPLPELFDDNMLFTNRYKGSITYAGDEKIDLICQDVTVKTKRKLSNTLEKFAEPQKIYPDRYSSLDIITDAMYMALERLNEAHAVQIIELNEIGEFGNRYTKRLVDIFTPFLFDIVELQFDQLSKTEKTDFRDEINRIFAQSHLAFILSERGYIEKVFKYEVLDNTIGENVGQITEVGLRDLLDEAIVLHRRPDDFSRKVAMEKIWDALERLKTYYSQLSKANSIEKIIYEIADGQQDLIDLFDTEFRALTSIGNDFRIRHHETNKIEITDPRHYDYFFNRCLSLIALAIQYLSRA